MGGGGCAQEIDDGDMWDECHKAVGVGPFSNSIRHSAAAATNNNDEDGGGRASPTLSSAAPSQETMMTMTATTIALPVMIKLMGAATVLVPHGVKLLPPPPSPAVDSTLLSLPSRPPLLWLVGLQGLQEVTTTTIKQSALRLGRGDAGRGNGNNGNDNGWHGTSVAQQ